jgi:hypothetical protein
MAAIYLISASKPFPLGTFLEVYSSRSLLFWNDVRETFF